jgi:hypothetical protein
VTNIQTAVDTCRNAYSALATWQAEQNRYNSEVTQAKKANKPANAIPKPGAQPAPVPAMCPPSTAYAIPASALPTATPGSA